MTFFTKCFTRCFTSLVRVLFLQTVPVIVFSQPVESWHDKIDQLVLNHQNSGLYILEKGEDALISRAWLVDNAKQSIDIQYFIWSADNIGTLATAALLRAANRGVHVRVMVDDFLIDADNDVLFALDAHPGIEIKIYNPNINVGTSFIGKLLNTAINFRSVNQRMHNKTVIVDNRVLITGGRNMADEYYDFDQKYNFRDRDVLVVGKASMQAVASFNEYWGSEYVEPVASLTGNPFSNDIDVFMFDDWGEMYEIDNKKREQEVMNVSLKKVLLMYQYLEEYESDISNFSSGMRSKINEIDRLFNEIVGQIRWVRAHFVADFPGKNKNTFMLGGGGRLTDELVGYVEQAQERITIQTPYLIMSDEAMELFERTLNRGVKIRIVTNSIDSTDNLLAYSGYSKQRKRLINSGIDIYEFKPDAQVREDVINRYNDMKLNAPVFSLHAKSMVIDGKQAYIGSFNFDPRSENLNTEAGIFIEDRMLARQVEQAIEHDMLPQNSWHIGEMKPDQEASIIKKSQVFFLKLIPMDGIL